MLKNTKLMASSAWWGPILPVLIPGLAGAIAQVATLVYLVVVYLKERKSGGPIFEHFRAAINLNLSTLIVYALLILPIFEPAMKIIMASTDDRVQMVELEAIIMDNIVALLIFGGLFLLVGIYGLVVTIIQIVKASREENPNNKLAIPFLGYKIK